jgi:hypothetical protein
MHSPADFALTFFAKTSEQVGIGTIVLLFRT